MKMLEEEKKFNKGIVPVRWGVSQCRMCEFGHSHGHSYDIVCVVVWVSVGFWQFYTV